MVLAQGKIGVLLLNLGSPQAPTASALRLFLHEFLSDRRIVDLPAWQWMPVLHGLILRTRPAKSAQKYQRIWTENGSPLISYSALLREALEQRLQDWGPGCVAVDFAMRYGEPATASVLDRMVHLGVKRILAIPLYPQYSSTTTASSLDAVGRWSKRQVFVPEFRFINGYHDDEAYIKALCQQVHSHWHAHGRAECLLMSFHGIPVSVHEAGDPYYAECRQTAHLLARALDLRDDEFRLTFQSRFGRAKWLEPATEPTLREMGRQGIRSVDVICPGFSADCLETLEEINMECRQVFLDNGGKDFRYIPCLNVQKAWVDALAGLVRQHVQGW